MQITVVKKTAMDKRLQFFFTIFSTSVPSSHTCWVSKLHWCFQKGQVVAGRELPHKGLSNSNGLTISTSPYVHVLNSPFMMLIVLKFI